MIYLFTYFYSEILFIHFLQNNIIVSFLLNMQTNLHLIDRFWVFLQYQSQSHISVCFLLLFRSEVNLNFGSKTHISEQNYNRV